MSYQFPSIASDLANPQFLGATNPDSMLAVRFYNRACPNPWKSSLEGRPIYDDRVYIEIFSPGQQLNIVDRGMYDSDKERFPIQWAHYMNSQSTAAMGAGTPLEQWPLLTPAVVAELKALKFLTVDMLANASDAQLKAINMIAGMGPHALQLRAQAYLQAAKDTALPQHQAAELAKRDEQISAQGKQIEELQQMLQAMMEEHRLAAQAQVPDKGKKAA